MQTSAVILVFGLVGLARSATDFSVYSWEHFKEDHGKKYDDPAEDIYRKSIFEERVAKINEHNKLFFSGLETSSMIINKFTDMLPNEVSGKRVRPSETSSAELFTPPKNIRIPEEVDWRTVDGVVSPVNDDGKCFCADFVMVAIDAVEAQLKLKKNISVSLSRQQVLDCAKRTAHGCEGIEGNTSSVENAFDFIKVNGGVEREQDYPYTAKSGLCNSYKAKVFANSKISGYKATGHNITAAIATVGPVTAIISSTDDNFLNYHSGIYENKSDFMCLDRSVLIVGYGTENGQKYYLVKNSWGEDWGMKGYIKMTRDSSGIATSNFFPVL